jgi:tetratricopeptide (TPR) repeat protein
VGRYPDFFAARFGLAKALWTKGEIEEALAETTQAVKIARNSSDRAASFMLRATMLARQGEFVGAEQAAGTAFEVAPDHGNIEWYLKRVYIQRRLGRFDACLEGLDEGRVRTGSIVLHALWVDALIDAGAAERALKEIDLQRRQVRLESGWRIRRGRALLALERSAEAKAELEEAVLELNERSEPDAEYPDIGLYVERGSALALLGRHEEGRKDFEAAKEAGADDLMLWRLRRDLGN